MTAVAEMLLHEAILLSAFVFILYGIDEVIVDLIYLIHRVNSRKCRKSLGIWSTDQAARCRFAVLVAAWEEAEVIGEMLCCALSRFDHPDYRIYVGVYPNDAATMAAVRAVPDPHRRIRIVTCERPGPTTKADCLNHLWTALLAEEAIDGRAYSAVVLHDAEDIVHPLELRVYAQWLQQFAAVQLPVMPLQHPSSPFVSGHYLDEFSEAHVRQLVVRQALGASLPLAGVGCALRRDLLQRISDLRGGLPFDAASLTEDYELGLTIEALGAKTAFVRVAEKPGGDVVAVSAYFPHTVRGAVRQKARWLTGIALAGWDRTGWGGRVRVSEYWMRMRDRRATLSMPVLAIAYATLLVWGALMFTRWVGDVGAPEMPPLLQYLVGVNVVLLLWRLAWRAVLVWRCYDARQAALSIPRVFVSNYIALLAARRALFAYLAILSGRHVPWDKTVHKFPENPGGSD